MPNWFLSHVLNPHGLENAVSKVTPWNDNTTFGRIADMGLGALIPGASMLGGLGKGIMEGENSWMGKYLPGMGGAGGKAGNLFDYIIPAYQAYKTYESNQQMEQLQRQIMAKLAAGPQTTLNPQETDAANLGVQDASNRGFNEAYSSLGGRNAIGNNSIAADTAFGLNNAQGLMKAREYFDIMTGHRQDWDTSLRDMLSLLSGQREDASAAGTGLEGTLRNIFGAKAYDTTGAPGGTPNTGGGSFPPLWKPNQPLVFGRT